MASSARTRSNDRKTEEKPKPVYSRKYWTGSSQIELAVWSKVIGEGDQEREVFNTSIKRTYKDGDNYKEGSAFRHDELPLLAAALQDAWQWIANELHRA